MTMKDTIGVDISKPAFDTFRLSTGEHRQFPNDRAGCAALNLWTRAMAKELGASGIRVNAIAPGAINITEKPRSTELIDLFVKDTALGRIGTPRDIAKAVRFLASDDAEFIKGQILEVSGGYRL